jgi:hypothetical protein
MSGHVPASALCRSCLLQIVDVAEANFMLRLFDCFLIENAGKVYLKLRRLMVLLNTVQ